MKKVLKCALTCAVLLLCLTSCTVNWFGETREVPWWTVAVPVVIVVLIAYFVIFTRTYVCPHCGFTFKPRWYELSALVHSFGSRIMKCPACGKRGFCKTYKR